MTLVESSTFDDARLAKLAAWARSRADWLESHPLTILVTLAAGYLAITIYLSHMKPLWIDEFYTLYIAQAGFKGTWEVLLTGADQHPPTFYWLTNLFLHVFGFGPTILRLPELLAFGVMLLCLFVVIARKTTNLIAYFAILFPCLTPVFGYAIEARGYGLLLGAAAAAYLFWEEASAGRYRRISVPLFAFFSSAAVCSHYYGILIMIPFALGEIARFLKQRKADVALWLAFFAPVVPLSFFLPVILSARGYSLNFWAPPMIWAIKDTIYLVFGFDLIFLLAFVIITVLLASIASQSKIVMLHRLAVPRNDFELHNIVVVLGFVALPGIGYLLAYFVTHAFVSRYVIACEIGTVIALAIFINVFCGNSKLLPLVLLGLGILGVAQNVRGARREAIGSRTLISDTAKTMGHYIKMGRPVLVANSHLFTQLEFYGSSDVKAKIFYAIDPIASLKYLGHDTIERGLSDLRPFFEGTEVFGGNTLSYRQLIAENSEFYTYGSIRSGDWNWLFDKLIEDGLELRLIEHNDAYLMFEVTKKTPGR
jgi:Dolichyl-phosphate-mannose-protein mannosyltransferase